MSKDFDATYRRVYHFSQPPAGGRSFVQQLYSGIAGGGPRGRQAVRMLIESTSLLAETEALTRGLTAPELQIVRQAVFEATLEDLAACNSPFQPPGPASRRLLAEDYHFIQLLQPPAEDAPYQECITYATLCFALEYHREGRSYFQKALARQPDNAFIQTSLANLTDCASLPRFAMAFFSRCTQAWKDTADALQKYTAGQLDASSLHATVRKTFQLWTGLRVDAVWDSRAGGLVLFSPLDWQCSLFLTQMAADIAQQVVPRSVLKTWGLGVASLPMQTVTDSNGNVVLDAEEIQVSLEDTPEHNGVYVKLYHPALVSYAACPGVLEDLTALVASRLDAADFCLHIRSVEILSKQPRRTTSSPKTLEGQLEELGYTTGHGLEEVEPLGMHRTYTRQPKEGDRLRDDITQGDTLLLALQEEYERHETDTADYFMTRGIAPVFLAWPRSITDRDPEAFTQKLVNRLEKEDGGNVRANMKLLGQAIGTKYCYLDLLLWSPTYINMALEKFLAKIPGGDQFRIQSFYWDAYPCPVSQAYVVEHSAVNKVGCPYQTAKPAETRRRSQGVWKRDPNPPAEDPASSQWVWKRSPPTEDSTPPKTGPKNKKKNAAKAKRKHQKKFH